MQTNKTKIAWWIVILLVILNITTISTIIVHNYNEKQADESIIIEPDSKPINGKYFRHELGFDNDQMEVFRQSNRTFRQQANRTVSEINLQKELMFTELQATDPDTVKLYEISKEIGRLHTELKEVTVQFYLSLNKVCTSEQKEKMKEIFTPLFIDLPISNNGKNKCNYENSINN